MVVGKGGALMDRLSDYTSSLETRRRQAAFPVYVKAMLTSESGGLLSALERHMDPVSFVEYQKGVVGALMGSVPGSPAGLDLIDLGNPWLALARRDTILGQLVGPLNAPPSLHVPVITSECVAGWVTEGEPIPATLPGTDTAFLQVTKLAAILGMSSEFLRATDNRAASVFDQQLRRGVAQMENRAVLSTSAAVPGTSPAGLLFGLSAVGGGGGDLAFDLAALVHAVRDGDPDQPTFVVSPKGAIYLASQNGSAFREVSAVGAGRLAGCPQVVSTAAGDKLILVDGAALAVFDGGIAVEPARAASVEMSDAPAGGAMVSAFMSNLVFLKVVRYLNWTLAHADAVAFIELPIGGSPSV
jgi:HK97 family phage major capsid protein